METMNCKTLKLALLIPERWRHHMENYFCLFPTTGPWREAIWKPCEGTTLEMLLYLHPAGPQHGAGTGKSTEMLDKKISLNSAN